MGNAPSKSRRSNKRRGDEDEESQMDVATRAQKYVGAVFADDDHPAVALIDSMCGTAFSHNDDHRNRRSKRKNGGGSSDVRSYYSEDAFSEDDSRTISEEETTVTDYPRKRATDDTTVDDSYVERRTKTEESSYEETDDDTERLTTVHTISQPNLSKQPLASSFAKRCYFTKGGIGGTTQHYEGLTLNGNSVLMLAAAMKLKGCPTICDEDLRRVEQTYPNQFSRLPDELLLSSGWRRISKYCHFSNKPIPDGIPFFHSKERLKDNNGYYFLLAAAVGMVRPIDVEPLNRDTLVLLETDFPGQCDVAPRVLIEDPLEWILVDKFCFFSGGPINTEEDVYYEADFDGNSIYMLAFLSPCLTPTELYKLDSDAAMTEAAVHEVESVYDLTDRDFDDLKLYHLGPCRALPPFILQPEAWTKVLPPPFLAARDTALSRAQEVEVHANYYPYEQGDQYAPQAVYDDQDFPEPYDQQQAEYEEPYDQRQYEESYDQAPPHHDVYNEPFDQQHDDYNEPYDQQHAHQHHHQQQPPFRQEPFQQEDPSVYGYGNHPRQTAAYDPVERSHQSRYTYTQPSGPYPYYSNGSDDYDTPRPPDPSTIGEGGGIDPPEDEPPSLRKTQHEPPHQYFEQEDEVPFNPTPDDEPPHYFEQEDEVPFNPTPDDEPEPFVETPSISIDEKLTSPMSSEPDFTAGFDNYSSQNDHHQHRQQHPPLNPRSPTDSDYSQTMAMRGAHEVLRNQRRGGDITPLSNGTMETDGSSEYSSVWTDNEPDRTSRRALILQMARARMKNSAAEEEKKVGDEIDLTGSLD